MKAGSRRALIVALSCVLVISVGMVIYKTAQYRAGGQSYAAAEKLAEAGESAPPSAAPTPQLPEEIRNIDLTALKKINPDVAGWLCIPGTGISYPLVYSAAKENTYYLTHTWEDKYNQVGAIFIDPANSPDLTDFNTVIYGHNMKDGSMFGALSRYGDENWLGGHPDIYLMNENGACRYRIFAAYETAVDSDAYLIGFSDVKSKQDYIRFCLESSAADAGVIPTAEESIITLSTCTGAGHATRWVIQAAAEK